VSVRPISRAELASHIRRHISAELYDEWEGECWGTAIYTLSDPRDIPRVRYVGQTTHPRRRFAQHLATARLWLPDEKPWWVSSPKLRPLYAWIRELYGDRRRLPTMIVHEWLEMESQARVAERARIRACIEQRLPLLNVEAEIKKMSRRRGA
jgi:hypothetical protein